MADLDGTDEVSASDNVDSDKHKDDIDMGAKATDKIEKTTNVDSDKHKDNIDMGAKATDKIDKTINVDSDKPKDNIDMGAKATDKIEKTTNVDSNKHKDDIDMGAKATDKIEKTTNDSESSIASDKAQDIQDNSLNQSVESESNQVSKKEEPNNEEEKGISEKELSCHNDYEVIDGKYYYTDTQSGQKYMYDEVASEWVISDDQQQVRTDEDGRTYYYAENMYLCRDPLGNVFYVDKDNKWVPWGTGTQSVTKFGNQEENSKWYFHQGSDMFFRDKISDVVYKLNKDKNDWEVYEGKLKTKRARIDLEEEFDTDEEDSDGEISTSSAPPGARHDPNIDYDGSMYTKRDPSDNMVYEWDVDRRAWFPKLDEDFMATYQLSYGFNPDGTKNENPLKFDDEAEAAEALRLEKEEEEKKLKISQPKKKATWFEMDENLNTKVYVSNLPDSTTEEDFLQLMQKCGMILKDTEKDQFKIKMYKDSEGNFKGDALCTYIKRESVELALQILDDYQVGNQRIRVEQAKFQLKGEYNPKLKPPKKKKKTLEKLQKTQEKLFDWRPEPMRGQRQKHERTIIIRNAFSPKEFENSVEKILTHKEALRNQCLNFGEITKFDLHDLHPEGVVQVTFLEVEAADMCAATLNNRLYVGRSLKVSTWDGKEKFKIEETEAEREERLKKWNKFLETGDDKK